MLGKRPGGEGLGNIISVWECMSRITTKAEYLFPQGKKGGVRGKGEGRKGEYGQERAAWRITLICLRISASVLKLWLRKIVGKDEALSET